MPVTPVDDAWRGPESVLERRPYRILVRRGETRRPCGRDEGEETTGMMNCVEVWMTSRPEKKNNNIE